MGLSLPASLSQAQSVVLGPSIVSPEQKLGTSNAGFSMGFDFLGPGKDLVVFSLRFLAHTIPRPVTGHKRGPAGAQDFSLRNGRELDSPASPA